MTEQENGQIGRLLAEAVPALPEPVDRVAEVRARVRRARLRAGGVAGAVTVAAAVAVVLAVPSVLAGTGGPGSGPGGTGPDSGQEPLAVPELDAGACPPPVDPGDPPALTPDESQQGPLVPEGAAAVLHCERDIIYPFEQGEPDRGEVVAWEVLTSEVDQLVAALNVLPTAEEVAADLPGGVDSLGCTAVGHPTSHSLVLAYPDGGTVTAAWDENCGTWAADGQVRFGWDSDVLALFADLYAEQHLPSPPPSGAPMPVVTETPE